MSAHTFFPLVSGNKTFLVSHPCSQMLGLSSCVWRVHQVWSHPFMCLYVCRLFSHSAGGGTHVLHLPYTRKSLMFVCPRSLCLHVSLSLKCARTHTQSIFPAKSCSFGCCLQNVLVLWLNKVMTGNAFPDPWVWAWLFLLSCLWVKFYQVLSFFFSEVQH